MFYKILDTHSPDWSNINTAAREILTSNIPNLRIEQVRIGMAGNIFFKKNQAIMRSLNSQFASLNYSVDDETTIVIHGHFKATQDKKTHISIRELTCIHFKISDPYSDLYLGRLDGTNLTNATGYAQLNDTLNRTRLTY